MENLSEKAETIWKVLTQFPEGTIVKRLQNITSMRKTVVYEALKELHSKDFVDHKKRLWIIKEKPLTEEVIIEQEDIRPSWCGDVKLSPRFCVKHGLPQFREVKHILHR
jgi:hypothetical protein